jgi:hypothetical protein
MKVTENWEKSIQIISKYDRINIKSAYYSYAKYLEGINEIDKAIEAFEISETAS